MIEKYNPLNIVPDRVKLLLGVAAASLAFAAAPALAKSHDDLKDAEIAALAVHQTDEGPPIQASTGGVTPTTRYRQPNQLPGYGIRISGKAIHRLAASSIDLYSGPPDGTAQPSSFCSAEKVRIGRLDLISTAAHCFENLTLETTGLLTPAEFPQPGRALNFIQRAYYDYSADNPLQRPANRQPLATISGISISTRETDAALLETQPSIAASPASDPGSRPYDTIPSLPYTADAHFTPGQQVGLFAMPESTHYAPVEETGTYLGRMLYVEDEAGGIRTRELDIVETDPDQPYEDACYFGASGSSFIARSGDKTAISGPLSLRINSKYDPYLVDVSGSTSTNPEVNLKQAVADENSWRQYVEQGLDVTINQGATICGYTVMQKTVQTSLINGFDNYVPPFPAIGMK